MSGLDPAAAPPPDRPGFVATRRRLLVAGGAGLVGLALGACSRDGSSGTGSATTAGGAPTTPATTGTATTTAAAGALTAASFAGLGTCRLLPEAVAGPFPLDRQFDRRDVTEGYPGHPVRLGLRVVDGGCNAVAGAAVEIWHADASGDYSAFADGGGGKDEGAGTTFLRGTQTADDQGIVEFLTIYPGWYRGRAVHIHLRVAVGGRRVLTGQIYFDDAYTRTVYQSEPYAAFGLPDTPNARDGIAGDPAAQGTLLSTVAGPTARGTGTLALLNLGVRA